MPYELTEEQTMLKETVRRIAREQIAPGAEKRDELAEFPWDMVGILRENALFGADFPEKFGGDCVISWRPVSTIITMPSFDEDAQRKQLREGFEKLRSCQVEVHMHTPMTVQNDISRISKWTQIAMQEVERITS